MDLAKLMKTVKIFERGQDRRYRLRVILTDIAIDWFINWITLLGYFNVQSGINEPW